MNQIDIAIIAVFCLSVLIGFVRGGLASILSTTGWILAIILNHYLFHNIEPFLQNKFSSKLLTFVIGYVGGIFLLLFLFSILNFIILSAVGQFKGGMIDRTIGVVFGGVRGGLLVIIVFLCFEIVMKTLSGSDSTHQVYPEVVLDAQTLPLLKRGELMLVEYMPQAFQEHLVVEQKPDFMNEMTLLNLVRKLSNNVSEGDLQEIHDTIDESSQYVAKRQVLIAKIKALWNIYKKQKHHKDKLSFDEIQKIQMIVS